MKNTFFNLGRVSVLLALGGTALVAQGTQTASATIDVVDGNGAALAGVSVRLTSNSLQIPRTGVTDANGRFVARLLPPGTYQIELSKDGFSTAKSTQAIGVDQNYQPRFVLKKEAGATVVVVSAASPAVDKSDAKTATNYQMAEIDQLPNGRTMEAVAFLTPGVAVGVGGRVQIRGAMTSGNLYLVDGQNVADNAYNNRGVQLIDESIEETQVITGAISAEYGSVDGGVMNAITKSGGNKFTGQLRWDIANPSWNAVQPYQNRASLDNKQNEIKTLTVGGFIIKDRLWFFGSYYKTEQTGFGTISANSLPYPGAAGANYVTSLKEIRRIGKLTWAINQDHTVVATFGNSANTQGNRNYSAGELAALDNQKNTSEYYSVSLRSVWSPAWVTDVRYGEKKQVLSAGPMSQTLSPFYNYDTGLFYNNGIFNAQDGGDNRNNKSANAKASYFFDAMGQHQLDFGFDWIKGISRARNEQSPTNMIFATYGMDLAAQTGYGSDVWTFQSAVGEATNTSIGLYVNDKWQVNNHLSLQLGLRYDKYTAAKEDGSTSAGASGISPRLGMKYDLFGDQKWIFGASYARYNGKVLDTIANSVTNQGNPSEIDYAYIGAGGPQSYATLYDLSNYDMSPSGIVWYSDPTVNIRLNRNMKAPHTDEFQVSAAYSFTTDMFGNGFVSLTGVTKKWKDLISYRVGNDGTVTDAFGNTPFLKVWDNDPFATREYKGLELQAQVTKGAFQVAGNISWSELKGNYEGEGSNTPGRGEALQNFAVVNGVQMYDRNVTAPYGYLAGHQPLRMRWTGLYNMTNQLGKASLGLVYRFDSGSHYSDTRTISRSRLNPALPASDFGTSATQYRDGMRGQFVLPGQAYLDLSFTQEFELFKVQGTPVNGFFKIIIGNVFNHQQIVGWNTLSNAATGAYPNGVTSPWVRNAAYGTSTTSGSFGAARTYNVSAGIRF